MVMMLVKGLYRIPGASPDGDSVRFYPDDPQVWASAGIAVRSNAGQVGVSRQRLHAWVARYLLEGVGGLADRSHRPRGCPHQVAAGIEVRVAEMRREHPAVGSDIGEA